MTVLWVDDDEYSTKIFSQILRSKGVEVVEAPCLAAARYYLEERQGEFDLIIWDANLPDGESYELIKKTRERFNGMMCAASNDPDNRRLQMEAGCDYEADPFERNEKILEILGINA